MSRSTKRLQSSKKRGNRERRYTPFDIHDADTVANDRSYQSSPVDMASDVIVLRSATNQTLIT